VNISGKPKTRAKPEHDDPCASHAKMNGMKRAQEA